MWLNRLALGAAIGTPQAVMNYYAILFDGNLTPTVIYYAVQTNGILSTLLRTIVIGPGQNVFANKFTNYF